MPKKAASTSSSSSEEDLTAFQSVAVTFEEITSKQKEVAEKGKQRIAGSSQRRSKVDRKSSSKGGDGVGAEQDSAGEDDDGPLDQLDPFQLKVAASLNSMLEGQLQLKVPGPKKRRREARAAEQAEAEADGTFRFFVRVKAGDPVVLHQDEPPLLPGTPFPDVFRSRRAPAPEEVAAALPLLAVDGGALMAAAAAAAASNAATPAFEGGTGCDGGDVVGAAGAAQAAEGSSEKAQQPQKQSKRQKQKQKKRVLQGHLGEGVVIDPRVFVPHHERMERLVGGAAGPGLVA